ncbi:Hypothetical protein with RimK-like ATP-grasp domain [Legionella longbeachae NSW150]|uniref:ATP-grasp fold RimK-type domain-containing protein n=1 Tax=Legionella longbeachae serogroup 1 (strain NSW150) TaxID=661367 RepID=D3HLM6_LEGLN|nr:ATP-grasp domain-containing protein [Legionella longbeachae]CBJ13346.1 Hypothetical protein with RimK-like ATP-grasp domain [Legionella longbeachae NSW150]
MSQLKSFIETSHRPEIIGGRLDRTHQTKFILDYSNSTNSNVLTVNSIAFGPKQDKVLLNLEQAIRNEDGILIFYYEDLHKRWSFVQTNHESYFIYKKNDLEQYRIKPNTLYIRGCQVDVNDEFWVLLGEFYNFVDCWEGKVVCAPKKQNNNESKLYQLSTSLKASSRDRNISIGKSNVLKGERALEHLSNNKSYIVKSLSGIRSIVVDDKEFKTWHLASINNLPVLFQEKVSGRDLRVHIVNGNVYGKLSLTKDEVDYRYDCNFFSLQDFHDFSDELKQFCIDVTQYEDNPLMGIDFIKTDSGYVVLEANPSPGWSAYHECNGIENDPFINDLLMELKNA